jgi:hypothetical protein
MVEKYPIILSIPCKLYVKLNMKLQIKSIYGHTLFEVEAESTKDLVQQAVAKRADLRGADLRGAYLEGADLGGANLRNASLEGAYLRGADLRGADLGGAYLRGAYLGGANLGGANLRGADLEGANLEGANLGGAYLGGAKDIPAIAIAQTRVVSEGEIIGYKKTVQGVVKLRIPAAAKRSNAFGRKCRAEYAEVIEMPPGIDIANSKHDINFTYTLGQVVRPLQPFDENWMEECASGIHFFITRIEAENY